MVDWRVATTNQTLALGISTLYLLRQDFGQVLGTLKKGHVKSWELFDDGSHSLTRAKVDQLTKTSKRNGVTFSVHGPICDLNPATLNPEVRPRVLTRLERSLRHSAMLNATCWVLHPGTHGALSWIHPDQDWKVNMESMRHLHDVGKKLGVEVLIENISAGGAILSRLKDFLRLYREWPNAPKLVLDVGHSHLKGETQQYLDRLGRQIQHIHVHDNKGDSDTHLAVGSGTISWSRFVRALISTGFEGDIVVESVKKPAASHERIQRLLGSLQ